MAKKTNKTNHVLNLLSTGVKKEEPASGETKETEIPSTVEVAVESVSETVPTVSVVTQQDEDVAEQIRMSLEKEFQAELEANLHVENVEENVEIPEELVETTGKEEADETEVVDTVDAGKQKIENTETESTESPTANVETTEPEEEEPFVMINVMERLVDMKIQGYMARFHCCTCSRCVADVKALALSALPAKYVVTKKDAISPLINFYTVKYTGMLAVEITKACMKVLESPRH